MPHKGQQPGFIPSAYFLDGAPCFARFFRFFEPNVSFPLKTSISRQTATERSTKIINICITIYCSINSLASSKKSQYTSSVSELFIVATPIGNLSDMTFRAIETFKTVDVIAAEDTRHTLQLLTHFEIRKPLVSCRSQNELEAAQKIVQLLDEGKNVAYASDAGTPGISDPGAVLVAEARKAGHKICPIPGASAFASLLSVAGIAGKTVIFEGFLSPKPGRRRSRLKELIATGDSFILYESPFRIVKLLTDIAEINNERRVVIGRELTKLHEEILEGTAGELRDDFSARSKILGEFAVFVAGEKKLKKTEDDADI